MRDDIFWKPAFEFLYNLGLFDVVLPFILVFTVVFAILEKTKVLGQHKDKPKTKLNSIIALSCGLLAVGMLELANAITFLSRYMAFVFVAVMLLAMLAAFLNMGSIENKTFGVVIGVLALGVLAVLALPVQGLFRMNWLRDILPWLILGLFFLGTFWFILRTKSEAKKPAGEEKKKEDKKGKKKDSEDEAPDQHELDPETKHQLLSQLDEMSEDEKLSVMQMAGAYQQTALQQMLRKRKE